MATITETIVLQNIGIIHLNEMPSSREYYQSKVAELVLISFPHMKDMDFVSQRAYTWCTKVLSNKLKITDVNDPNYIDLETFKVYLLDRIEKLLNRVLVEPIDRLPLREAFIDQGQAWEGWRLREFQELTGTNTSPFTGLPMEPVPFAFANKLRQWSWSILGPDVAQAPLAGESSIVRANDADPSKIAFRKFKYFYNASKALKAQNEYWERKESKIRAQQARKDADDLRAAQTKNFEVLNAMVTELKTEGDAKINHLEKTIKADNQVLHARVDHEVDRRVRVEQDNAKQAAEITRINAELQKVQADLNDKQNQLNHINHKAGKRGWLRRIF